MTLKQIGELGKQLALFLAQFADCFRRREGRDLLRIYVRGLLSEIHRKTAEAIALDQGVAPRTLQRFLEFIKWDEEKLRDRCQQIVAKDRPAQEKRLRATLHKQVPARHDEGQAPACRAISLMTKGSLTRL